MTLDFCKFKRTVDNGIVRLDEAVLGSIPTP